jgi:hypothetical protein
VAREALQVQVSQEPVRVMPSGLLAVAFRGHLALTTFTITLMRVSIGWPSSSVGKNSQALTAFRAASAKP